MVSSAAWCWSAPVWWVIPAVLAAVVAKVKLLPMWHEHRQAQEAIKANQAEILRRSATPSPKDG